MRQSKRLAVALVAAAAFVAFTATPANADDTSRRVADTTVEEVAPVVVDDATVVFSHTGWALVTVVLLPILIGISRKESLSTRWKYVTAAAVTIVVAIVERAFLLPDGGVAISIDMVVDAVGLFIGSQFALQGYDKLGNGRSSLARLAPKVGIG